MSITLYLLVVIMTTGCGQATAPSGWGVPQVCPASWDEARKKEEVAQLGSQKKLLIFYLLTCNGK